MSIRFSRVKVMAADKAALFLVGGIPTTQNDLACWTAFQSFSKELEENTRSKSAKLRIIERIK